MKTVLKILMKIAMPLGLFIATLTVGCSSISLKQGWKNQLWPPEDLSQPEPEISPLAIDQKLETQLRAKPSEAMRLLVRYKQARLWSAADPVKSCAIWVEVATNPRFPVSAVARLRALETCPNDRQETELFARQAAETKESWLKEATARASLARATRAGDKAAEVRWLIETVPFEKNQAAQIELLERALDIARDAGDSLAAERAKDALLKTAPRKILEPKREQLLAVAGDFRKARDFERARELYRKVAVDDDFGDLDKLKAFDGIRMTYKLENRRDEFLNATRDYAKFARKRLRGSKEKSDLARYLDTRITLARAIWTENSGQEAKSILKQVENEITGRYPIGESLFLRARIEEEAGHLKLAAKLMDQIDDKSVSDRSLRMKIQWYRAWNLRKLGRLAEAAAKFEKLARDDESPTAIARDRFWLGRTLGDLGKPEAAEGEFNWLIENDPIGYYGTLAARELKRKLPALRDAATAARWPALSSEPPATSILHMADDNSPLAPEERLIFEWLMAVGELELGRAFLDAKAPREIPGKLNEPRMLAVLNDYARAGAYQSLFGRLADLSAESRRTLLLDRPGLIFPRPWPLLVEKASARSGVQPELIYSIIRQESSFNPNSRSSADAFGLMQLIPEVAKPTAKAADVEYRAPEDLYRPELNIPLGAVFLQQTLKNWNGRFVPSVASYNASEKAVAGWLKTRDRKDPLAFIEDIPYDETRNYVKLVMRNYVFYSRLATVESEIPFPEWCLAGLQDVKP